MTGWLARVKRLPGTACRRAGWRGHRFSFESRLATVGLKPSYQNTETKRSFDSLPLFNVGEIASAGRGMTGTDSASVVVSRVPYFPPLRRSPDCCAAARLLCNEMLELRSYLELDSQMCPIRRGAAANDARGRAIPNRSGQIDLSA
jgi:hypothetical protein